MAPLPLPAATVETDWETYLRQPPIECRHLISSSTLAPPSHTHNPSSSAKKICGAETVINEGLIASRIEGKSIITFLRNAEKIIPDSQITSTLFNEQAVSEVLYSNVLEPVRYALATLFGPALEKLSLKKANYFFNIRSQQIATSNTDQTRSDHYLVLEHLHGIDNELALPHKKCFWSTPEEFGQAIQKINSWNSDMQSLPPPYPTLVLCVIEEKKPNVVFPEEFKTGYEEKKGNIKAENVVKIMPQLKRYSAEARCNYVLLSDYVQTLLLDIKETGVRYDSERRMFKPNGIPAEAEIETIGKDNKRFTPRYVLFTAAVLRLEGSGIISFRDNNIDLIK